MPSKSKEGHSAKQVSSAKFNASEKTGVFHRVRFLLYSFLKRVLDILLSTSFLIILFPLFIIVAILIKIDSRGPVFFRQERTGKNGKVFRICKFRSMTVDNDMRDTSCEDKYTRVGRILRRTSIDELPQLFNVFFGQMSFIGPRPWVVEYWENMNEVERGRAKVRPGITGLAQAKGRNGLSIFEKIGYDLEYVEHFSLWQDIKVIILTIVTVVKGEEVNVGKSGIRDEIGALKAR